MAGRPTDYDPKYCDMVIEAGSKGLSLTAFAGMADVCRATVNNWMAAHSEFKEAVAVAKAKRTLFLETGMLDPIASGPMVTARRFALVNADPEEWRDKQEVEHKGQVALVPTINFNGKSG